MIVKEMGRRGTAMTSDIEAPSIREMAFQEILKTRVDDGVFCLEESGCCSASCEIRAVGLLNGELIAAKKTWELIRRGALAIDEEGLPCYDSESCGKNVKEYDEAFLGNYQWAMAMGRMHQTLIETIQALVLKENQEVKKRYTDFKNIELPRKLAEAKNRLKLAEYAGKEPNYADEQLIEAANRAERIHKHTTRKDKSELFRIWYVDYIKSKGYEKKIKETHQLYKFDVEKYLSSEISQLKRSGFRMIRKSQMPNELESLHSRSTSSSS